ncbi:MAG: hypothetical protein PUF12_01825 [Thermoflexaceae bacterium]|nr:hypothetical protein [Thermoflexaceae bacterium]
MDLKDFCYKGEKPDLKKIPESAYDLGITKEEKEKYVEKTEQNILRIAELQDKLYAEGREGVIIVLQAMDAAGKDGTIKHVMSGVNPQGVHVISFKQPTSRELEHDYLWRVNQALPRRGEIAVFNRSHYEDVLVTQIHGMEYGYNMAERCLKDGSKKFYEKRYKQICNYEEYLYENSYRMVKIFLNVSKKEQKRRFMDRINDAGKNWKFSAGDLDERKLWDEYHELYEEIIEKTGTKNCPWYIVPADQKWYERYLVSEIVIKVLEDCEPKYPELPDEEKAKLAECKRLLEAEEN